MHHDSVPLLLIKFKYGSNRSQLFPLSLIKFKYEKNGSHLCFTFENQRHDLVGINNL
jgi:hypothetical protein